MTKEQITQLAVKETKIKKVQAGTVLFSFKLSIGKIGITEIPMYTNEAIAAFPIRDEKVLCKEYFIYALSRIDASRSMDRAVMGTTLNKKKLAELKIPLPPLPEQKRIAAILDKADAIRRKRRQAIQLADEFLRSVFLDMFGDPVTNPKGWEKRGLNEVGLLARGKSKHRPRNAPELLDGPYPLIQTGEVAKADHYITTYNQTYSELGLKQSKLWPAKTLCITIAANIADSAILTFDACFPDSVVGFTPNKLVRTEYIHMWLTFYQNIIREKAPESAQKNINLKILSELQIPIPPLNEQDKFVTCFKHVEMAKAKKRKSHIEIEDCFASLSQEAFRGEL